MAAEIEVVKQFVVLDQYRRPVGSFSNYKEAYDYCVGFLLLRNIACQILDRGSSSGNLA